jgi:integrase
MFLAETPEAERSGPVFVLPKRKFKNVDACAEWVGKIVSDIGRKAGVIVRTDPADPARKKYASAHDLRRAFGDRWAARVMPAVLKELMRHESIETTLRYYVGVNAERTAEVCWSAIPGAAAGYAAACGNGFGNTTPSAVTKDT